MKGRLHYIDWLRVLAVLLLFPYHTARVLDFGDPFYIKGPDLSVALAYALAFVDRWHMPLLFLLAGASTFFAMSKRTGGQYLLERAKRLLVPFLFGWLVLIPPQTWVGGRFNAGWLGSHYTGSFLHYMTSGDWLMLNLGPGGDYYGGFGVGHLWFILWLLLVSLLAFPLVLWGRSEKGGTVIGRWARALAKPGWWLLPPLIIWFSEGLPDIAGKNPFYYLAFFALGYVVMRDTAFAESAERHMWWTLAAGAAICAVYVAAGAYRNALPDPSWQLFVANYGGFLGAWLTIVGLIGIGRRFLDRPSKALSYLAEASYPVYVIHQTIIVLAAVRVVTWPVSWPLHWLALMAVSAVVTFALYEGVRRLAPLRFLFGMRPNVPPKETVA